MSTSFPVELWAHVASLINRSDLMNLALVSRLHLEISRQIFCQRLTLNVSRFPVLESGEKEMHQIRNYIVKYNLRSTVQELVVWGYSIKPALDKLLEVTPGLRSLSMIIAGCQVFLASANAQKKFVKHLKTSCPGLEAFRLNAAALLKDGDFSIPNLRAVKWKEFGRVSPAFVSLCRASRLTLTEISLAIYDGAYTEFFRLTFPNLILFKIGPGSHRYGSNTTRAEAISSGLTSFLVAHPSIETLNLVYPTITPMDSAICISFWPKLLTPDMLPNLKMLHAHPSQVSQLATANVEFLGSLKTLSLSDKSWFDGEKYAYDYSGMLETLVTKRPLFVRHFICRRPYQNTRAQNFAGDMCNVVDAFPELETWVGSSPERCTANQLAEIFSQLPKIREISYDTAFVSSEKFTTKKVKLLAERCPSLERFVWRDMLPHRTFTVIRLHDQIVINSGPLIEDERKDYHVDSDASNEQPRSDDEWSSDEDEDNDNNGQEGDGIDGAEDGGVEDNEHDMSDGMGSSQEVSEDSEYDD